MDKYFDSEPMKYWAPPASMPAATKRQHLENMIASGNYLYSLKTDGNWARAVLTNENRVLQTRGISKVTGTYGQIQDKVKFWPDVEAAFQNGDTVILGEIYLPGKIDKDIGAILRCLTDKALARQKNESLRWRIFDVLALDGKDLMDRPITERVSHISEVVKRINSPLVEAVQYYEMDEKFFDNLSEIFASGGEGVVCYKKSSTYEPGKRGPHSWDTCKVKQEIENVIDCFIIGTVQGERVYDGKDLKNWQYWENEQTGERLLGNYYIQFSEGHPVTPLTRNAYYNWPAAIEVAVYDNQHRVIPLCKVSGLTDEFRTSLRDNFYSRWCMCPVSIGGMMISTAKAHNDGIGISVRHPYLRAIRENDINPDDCTLEKILS